MNRTALAFAIAPLLVPLLVAGGFWFGGGGQAAPLAVLVSTAFAYGGTYLLAAPAFLFLRSRGYTSRWLAVVTGFAVGALTYHVFLVLFSLALGASIEVTLARFAESSLRNPMMVGAPGLLGALVGVTLWAIARPDQHS